MPGVLLKFQLLRGAYQFCSFIRIHTQSDPQTMVEVLYLSPFAPVTGGTSGLQHRYQHIYVARKRNTNCIHLHTCWRWAYSSTADLNQWEHVGTLASKVLPFVSRMPWHDFAVAWSWGPQWPGSYCWMLMSVGPPKQFRYTLFKMFLGTGQGNSGWST